MPKIDCFSASIFGRFGLDFGASWASNLDPSWPLEPEKNYHARPISSKLKFKISSIKFWRAPGSIFEAPGLDFGGSGDEFFEILDFLAEKMQELISNLPLKLRGSSWKLELPIHLTPTSNFNHDFRGRVAGGDPPPGVFNPLPTEGVRSVSDPKSICLRPGFKCPTLSF